MNEIMPFMFGESVVRVITDENGEPWFVAKDVCRVLGLENNRDAVSSLDEDEKITVANPDGNPRAGIPHRYVVISESGLYALVFRSRKPQAREFSRWVRKEVLPALRKTGRYEVSGRQPVLEPPASFPPEALRLRPAMRQKLWRDALNTARLDDGGTPAALRWFAYLCGMVAAMPPAPTPARDKVRAFFWQCCEYADGCRVSGGALYEAFRRWCEESGQGDVPSMKVFGSLMQEFAQRCRSNGSFYDGVRLKPAV